MPGHAPLGRPVRRRDRAGATAAPQRGDLRPPLPVRRRGGGRRHPRTGCRSAARRATRRVRRTAAGARRPPRISSLFRVVEAGGVTRAPDAEALRAGLPGAYGELRRAADALLSTNSFMDRLEATRVVTPDRAPRRRPGRPPG